MHRPRGFLYEVEGDGVMCAAWINVNNEHSFAKTHGQLVKIE